MVSQKFMGILHQQPHYSKPSTSSGSSTGNSNVQNPLQIIKQENDLDIASNEEHSYSIESDSFDPLRIVKEEDKVINEENEDLTIGEREQNRNDDRHPSGSNMKSYMLPFEELSKDKSSISRSSSKRIRREKIIFDPSLDTSNSKRKSRKMVYNTKKMPCISVTKKSSSETSQTSKEDMMGHNKVQFDGNLTCEYCGKYMQRLDYLRLHLMKHTGETPHKCPHCKNGYRARWRLAQHLRTHTKNLPYHCPYCNYRGNRSDYLTSHINRVHRKLIKEDKDNATIKKEEFS